jgi:hypothetical protein
MKFASKIPLLLVLAVCSLAAAQDEAPPEPRFDFRYSFAAINDTTIYSGLHPPLPAAFTSLLKDPTVSLLQNQLLIEPAFTLRYRHRWSLSTSAAGLGESFRGLSVSDFDPPPGNQAIVHGLGSALDGYTGAHEQLRVKEAYAGLSAGDFDFTLGRRLVRWGTGYAFTPAGVLDPPRVPTNPTDRLNLNEGRDMIKVDYVHGPHAVQVAWSSAALAPPLSNAHDTTAVRYNILLRGFDTCLIAGDDRGGDAFGGFTFTRVLGQAWEIHGEGIWREQAAAVLGAKYITSSGITFIGEFYTPPNTAYFRDQSLSPTSGRPHYAFFDVSKSRLRELPGWKEWDLGAYMVANLDDRSYTAIFEATRRFGNRFSAYLHLEAPQGARTSDYGATPYTAATSMGVRFQL